MECIFNVIKGCTNEGIVDKNRAEDILNPQNGEIRVSSAFMDNLNGREESKTEVKVFMELLERVYDGRIKSSLELENKLKELDFKTLSIIDEILEKINDGTFNERTYEYFKEIMYRTDNKEIFKLSIEMTGVYFRCKELINEYMVIGQVEEFSRYISFVLISWSGEKECVDALFTLLDLSSDWGSINEGEFLLRQEGIMESIDNQRRILIGTLKNNCIPMEIGSTLARHLDLLKLLKESREDRELFDMILILFHTLFFHPNPCGGLLDLHNDMELLEGYMDLIETTPLKSHGLLGGKYLLEFLKDEENSEYIKENYGLKEWNGKYNRVKSFWESCYNEESIIQSINEDVGVFEWIEFSNNTPLEGVIEKLEEVYINKTKEYYGLEHLLILHGSRGILEKIYEDFKDEYNKGRWKGENYSYINIFGEEFKNSRELVKKIVVCGRIQTKEAKEYLIKLLSANNPEIRWEALKSIELIEDDLLEEELKVAIKERLKDAPYYIRRDGLLFCFSRGITITEEEYKEITLKLSSLGEKDYDSFLERLKGIIK